MTTETQQQPLSHRDVMNLWNVEAGAEVRTEVRTFWFDDEYTARAFGAALDGDVRFHHEPRSPLGAYRVVSYRPA